MSVLRTHIPLSVATLVALIAPMALAVDIAEPQAGKSVVVVAPPWRDADRIALQSGGLIISTDVISFIAVAYSPNPAFANDLIDQGASLVFSSEIGNLILCR